MKKTTLRERPRAQAIYDRARSQGLSHVQADILSRRNIAAAGDLAAFLEPKLRAIPAPGLLKNCEKAVQRIVVAIKKGENIGLVTDYDVDGLAAHAVAQRALCSCFGVEQGRVHSFVGNRLQDGYGLTDDLCRRILTHAPGINLVITADCGVSDEKRLALLKNAGIDVIVTDHHLVAEEDFPHSAYTMVNPQQRDCPYPDKAISGCMVCWLVLSAVRSTLLGQGMIAAGTPTLISLLDYVALATIADSVSLLSLTNRAVVRYGLQEINLMARECWKVMQFGGSPVNRLTEDDLAFQVSPRINGAGRMGDPQLALDFLLAGSVGHADEIFKKLTEINQLRKKHEAICMDIAQELVPSAIAGIVVFHPDFHPGITGIIASRLAETHGVPTVVFSKTKDEGVLSGSCRTGGAPTTHIRDLLARAVAGEQAAGQENTISFGGHKGAAGIKIHEQGLTEFRRFFLAAIADSGGEGDGLKVIETDGALAPGAINLATAEEIASLAPFGQHFEHPAFANTFQVESVKFVGLDKDHLQLTLSIGPSHYRGIWFRARSKNKEAAEATVTGTEIHCLYQLSSNEFRGRRSLQLCINAVNKEIAE